MPNAPTHDLITLVTAGVANVAYFHFSPHPELSLAALFTVTFVFAGYACAGDLDLQSAEYRRWGILRFLWLPYQKLVPHRSWISHGLIAGGIIRVTYLAVVATIVFWVSLWAYSRLGPHVDATRSTETAWRFLLHWVQQHQPETSTGLSGFILAGTTHSLADYIYTGIKRRTHRFR